MNKGQHNPRYKTALCKKYLESQSCPYGNKCQFAHGEQELRSMNAQPQNMMYMRMGSKNNILNYKIVKCKNWEKDKTCKYGSHCTYAHGDEEIRNKADNLYQMNPIAYPSFMMPMIPGPNMDVNQMQQLMANNQLYMQMQMNMNMGNKPEEMQQNQNNDKTE
jgi:hypothetical protein